MKVGDLVKAIPLAKWDINPEDNAHIGVVTKLGVGSECFILLNFGDDDGIFHTSDWKLEVISENR